MKKNPTISIIIPTLNAAKILNICLGLIRKQNYPQSKIEIIIADGGSTDKTLAIAKKFKCKIVSNPLKTAEAGKAVGVKYANGQYIALIDSDNFLPEKNWINRMISPLEIDPTLIGSEPIKFTYRKQGGFMERYSALFGVNDPYAFITGIYDRQNYINNKWTNLKIETIDFKNYLKVKLEPNKILPTIGANGTIFRAVFLKENCKLDYLFDIDLISEYLHKTKKPIFFAKVKIGIIHTFCESSISKFIRKQKRRIIDFYYYQKLRQFDWQTVNDSGKNKFILYTILIFPALFDSTRGFINKPDWVWFMHPILCLITLYIYISITIKFKLGLLKPLDRKNWKQ